MRLTSVLMFALLLLTMGCAKRPGPLTWRPDPDPGLLAIDAADAKERAELREALVHLQRVHFDYDSAILSEESRNALIEARLKLGDKPTVHVFVEGHADERGSTEYNVGLGEERGRVVAKYLEALGMAPDRLHVISYGEEKPLVDGHDETAWAANRRVDFRVMRGDLEIELARR